MKLDDLKAELDDAAKGLAYNSIQNGCADCGLAANLATRSLTAITDLEALVGELEEALRELEQTEADYRHMHDLHGGGSIKTGRRWDLMRRAGDKARATLAKLEKARG